MNGAAYVGWDSTYSFNADARAFPVERIEALRYPQIRPAGVIDFTAEGSGTFSVLPHDVKFGATWS